MKGHKVGGSSIYSSLCQFLGPEDIHRNADILAESDIEPKEPHEFNTKDFKNLRAYAKPSRIRSKVGNDIWDEYCIVGSVRNPWDAYVSFYHWSNEIEGILEKDTFEETKIDFNKRTKNFLNDFNKAKIWGVNYNDKYLFEDTGKPIFDKVIRFESLQKDYDAFCNSVGLAENKLLRLKTTSRKAFKKYHYREYYDGELLSLIHKQHQFSIDYFNYEF